MNGESDPPQKVYELFKDGDGPKRASARGINQLFDNNQNTDTAGISWKLVGSSLNVVAAEMKQKKNVASAAHSVGGDEDMAQ